MAYDVDEQVLLDTINNSNIPDSAKSVISSLLAPTDPLDPNFGTDPTVDTLSGGGAVDPTADLAEITGTGVYDANGTPVVIVNTDEDVQITYTVGSSTFIILAGQGDDLIVLQDGVPLSDGTSTTVPGGTVELGDGNDSVVGSSGNDSISGGTGNDSISGGSGRDQITVGDGNDSVDGGANFDQAFLQAGRTSYTITVENGGLVIVATDGSQTNTLTGVEFVRFDDNSIVTAMANQDQGVVARLYEAILNREADETGLQGWVSGLQDGSLELATIAAGFVNSQEFQNLTSGLTNSAFIDLMYQQTFGREADTAGKAGWLDLLDSGAITREGIAIGFAASQEAIESFDYIQIVGSNVDFS
ncbi:MAG: DUF4214 domain-containing protein [Roseibium sp.]|nr:DUF4214 domain-containing protein [Roseibium sp.]